MGKVRDRDRGWKRIQQAVQKIAAQRPEVRVGVIGRAGAEVYPDGKGMTIADVAVVHEFGAGRIPERSFIRSTLDKNERTYQKMLAGAGAVLVEPSGRPVAALRRLGLKVEGDIKQTIADGIPPPLSPVTLERKGPDKTTPLIDTGRLRGAITSEVKVG